MRGRGLVRRRTVTSCRSTRSSTSLVEEVRPISRTSPSTRRKIKYSSRSDTPGSCPTSDHRWSATQARLLAPHRVVGGPYGGLDLDVSSRSSHELLQLRVAHLVD